MVKEGWYYWGSVHERMKRKVEGILERVSCSYGQCMIIIERPEPSLRDIIMNNGPSPEPYYGKKTCPV